MSNNERVGPYISELSAGQRVRGIYGVQKKQLRSFRDPNKGHYLDLKLGDLSGSLSARVWEDARSLTNMFDEGDVVCVRGTVQVYRGENQLTIDEISKVEAETVSAERFIPKSPRCQQKMQEELWQHIECIEDSHLAELLSRMFGDPDFYRQYTLKPAAKQVHHGYLHGLLEHSLEVANLAAHHAPQREELNTDLLLAGAILHDVGKIEELKCTGSIQYSENGRLLGHVAIGYRIVSSAVDEMDDFPAPLSRHLKHLILSHHGEQEYGAPVVPQTREAVVLHQADLYSGRAAQVAVASEHARRKGESWSDYDRLLERYIWIPENKTQD